MNSQYTVGLNALCVAEEHKLAHRVSVLQNLFPTICREFKTTETLPSSTADIAESDIDNIIDHVEENDSHEDDEDTCSEWPSFIMNFEASYPCCPVSVILNNFHSDSRWCV